MGEKVGGARMETQRKSAELRFGKAASYSAAIVTVIFGVSLIVGLVDRSPVWPAIGYGASGILAISVVALMAAVYSRIASGPRLFGLLGLVAAVLYAPLCLSNYFLQLAVVSTNPLQHPKEVLKLIAFVPGSPTFALDMLGYFFLCLSTLAVAFTITDQRDRALRVLCMVHGAVAVPTIAAPIISGMFRSSGSQANDVGSYILLFWCALFTPIALLFARSFRES
jgi:hypothetical protein